MKFITFTGLNGKQYTVPVGQIVWCLWDGVDYEVWFLITNGALDRELKKIKLSQAEYGNMIARLDPVN